MLTIYTSNRLDTLVDRLASEMWSSPLPPLDQEIVVVQSEGMQRWLTLELARRQGIAASLTTPFPRPFCRWLARCVLDGETLPRSESIPRRDDSIFGRESLSWRLFGLLGELQEVEALRDSAPAAYLADDPDQRKRFQLAQRLGSLFDDYQMFRPEMLDAWQRGATTAKPSSNTEAWQAELWRRLVWSADGEQPFSRRLSRLTGRLESATKEPPGLPSRLWVLGVSTLPPAFVRLLAGVARWRFVGILFVSPTYQYWGDLRSDREVARLRRRVRAEALDEGRDQHLEQGNPLLAALGRQGREFFDLLQRADPSGAAWHDLQFTDPVELASEASGLHSPCERGMVGSGEGGQFGSPTVLARLQSDILHLIDRTDPEGPGPVAWPREDQNGTDPSLEVHACHAPMREMEVLKDRLLDAFSNDDALRPADVLVLVPDIELYGPYIQAVFGGQSGDREMDQGSDAVGTGSAVPPTIPYSIADRRAGQEQPLAETILQVLDLVRSRATLPDVFDLLDIAAVRRRFDIEAADVADLRRLAVKTRIRWGFDGRHRERVFEVPLAEQNTWRAGLDRLVLGYATGGVEKLLETPHGVALPFAGDTTGAVEALGRFVHFVRTLAQVLDGLRRRRSFDEWADALLDALDRLYLPESDEEERGVQAVRDAVDDLRRLAMVASPLQPARYGPSARDGGAEERAAPEARDVPRTNPLEVHLQVVREHLDAKLSTEGFGSGFLAGKVTFCALRPMRTIPFRVIAIAGLDGGAFPRRDRRPGFDLMASARRPGDRSLRDDDRYLFLETLLAARSRLILTFVGFSQRDAKPREPSVVLSELLDQVDRTFVCREGGPARQRLIVEHPLQPWSPRYFTAEGRVPQSFDVSHWRAAKALRAGGDPVPSFAFTVLPRGTEGPFVEVTVDDLVRFWTHPIRAFCRRLGIVLEASEPGMEPEAQAQDAEPFAVGGLDGFGIRQWLVERRLDSQWATSRARGEAEREDYEILRAQGILPPGTLGEMAWTELSRRVDEFLRRLPGEPRLESVEVDLRGGADHPEAGLRWRLIGRLEGRTARGLVRARCGGLRAADRLRTWIEHLALSASVDRLESTRLIGESQEYVFQPPGDGIPWLDSLIDGYVQGLCRPLPVIAETTLAWAEQARAAADPRRRISATPRAVAAQVFEGRFRVGDAPASEESDPYLRQCFRDGHLLDHPEVGRWAERLWWPLFDHERDVL